MRRAINMIANGCETDITSNVNHCGACGRVCAAPQMMPRCVAGVCVVPGGGCCSQQFCDCDNSPANGCETNVTTDAKNCGMCGHACAMGQICAQGICK